MDEDPQPLALLRLQLGVCPLYAGRQVRIGRAADNELVLNDPKVSRYHAIIDPNENGFLLRDLGSINGTYVNMQRLSDQARMLRDGDVISITGQVLVFEIVRVSSATPVDQNNAAVTIHAPVEGTRELKGPRLVVSSGPDMGQIFPLWGETITIGRASREATWEIRLTDRSISRPHACLERRETGFYLLDLQSANGTTINGDPVGQPVLVQEGDVIALGETRLVFYQ